MGAGNAHRPMRRARYPFIPLRQPRLHSSLLTWGRNRPEAYVGVGEKRKIAVPVRNPAELGVK